MKIEAKSIILFLLILASLSAVIGIGVYMRASTLNSPTVLDYDPWWWYRHAKEIHDNNFKIPNWDVLSYYPPGRPYDRAQGWPYTIGIMYEVLHKVSSNIDFMRAAILSPLIMVALIPIPAFLLGRLLSNNIGGIVTALFAVVAPTFIGVSMAGYADTDAPVFFYMLFTAFTIILAIKMSNKKLLSIPFYVLAVLSNLIFTFTWGAGWLTLILFMAFIPSFVVFRLIEEMWHRKKAKIFWKELVPDFKAIFYPLLIIFIATNIIGFMLGFKTMFHSLIGGLAFTGLGGEPLIVNISVAELQIINIFSKVGFFTVANRVGLVPTLLTLIGLPLLVFYKLWKKEKINFVEIFLYVWALVTFYLILKGVRFSLFFLVPASISAGYVIGNVFNYVKSKNLLITSSLFAIVGVLVFMAISNGMGTGFASGGLSVSQNWYDAMDWLKGNADKNALLATWWDPGHILAGYTGLKVHADGAHCGLSCEPYNHNTRIRDMGRLLSTTNETESLEIVKKYNHLTQEQCDQVRRTFKNIPDDACNDVSEVYVLATSDLIGKYFWMRCFGTFDMNLWTSTGGSQHKCEEDTYLQLNFVQFDNQGSPMYSNGQISINLLQNGTQIIGVMNAPSQGIRNALVKDAVYFNNGAQMRSKVDAENAMNSMIWIDPSFRVILYMDSTIRDSVFTKMFLFNGEGLNNYQLVYSNPEVKIYKAKL